MSKSELSREDLVAQLEALDKADEAASLEREVADLKANNTALAKERDIAIKRIRELEKILKGIHTALKPVAESLESGGEVRRGRVYSPERAQVLREAAAKTAQAYSSANRVKASMTGRRKPSEKELSAIFPELEQLSSNSQDAEK